MTINYRATEEFEKDLKRLLKRFPTLKEDLEVAKRNAIELYHLQKINNQSVFPIPGFCTERIQICKVKKFACKSLKGSGVRSGIRIIYAYCPTESLVEFIEIYFKGGKENENRERIEILLKERNL